MCLIFLALVFVLIFGAGLSELDFVGFFCWWCSQGSFPQPASFFFGVAWLVRLIGSNCYI